MDDDLQNVDKYGVSDPTKHQVTAAPSYFFFDVSHDLAQGHTSLKSQGYTGERIL
jgi:hypothetical protein